MVKSVNKKRAGIGIAAVVLIALSLLGVIPSPLPSLIGSNDTSIDIEAGATGKATVVLPATPGDIELTLPSDLVEIAPRGNIVVERATPDGYTALVRGCSLGCDVELNLRAGATGSIKVTYLDPEGGSVEDTTVRYG